MKLIVGLGNPGKEYEKTRHNMGFMAIDRFADSLGVDIDQKDFQGLYKRVHYLNQDLILLKPQTYMNLSGQSVSSFLSYYKIKLENVLVIFDDLSLQPGKIRLRKNGSSGGQKGMQNIINLLHSDQIKRIRVGIGEPKWNTVDYVLGKPTSEEAPLIDAALDNAVEALKTFLKTDDFDKAMNLFNGK